MFNKNGGKRGLIRAASPIACAVVAWASAYKLGPTEFSGGRLTGPLLTSTNVGLCLFVVASFLMIRFARLGAGIAIVASLCTMPLYLYLIAPGLFRHFSKGEYSVPLTRALVWDKLAIIGILTVAIASYLCVRSLLSVHNAATVSDRG
jgi:hypothetical protein